jgi:hypothetical protein
VTHCSRVSKAAAALLVTAQTALAVLDVGVVEILAPSGSVPTESLVPQVLVRNSGTERESLDVALSLVGTLYEAAICLPGGLPVGVDTMVEFTKWAGLPGEYVARCTVMLAGDERESNNLLELPFRVVAPETGWTALADMPPGPKNKKVKNGGGLAYGAAPVRAPGHGKPGVGLTDAGGDFVYAFKGNNTCEFYRLRLAADTWEKAESIPALGSSRRKKAVKKSSALTVSRGWVYAVKGGSTLEFWRYGQGTTGMQWFQLPDVPAGGKPLREGTGLAACETEGTGSVIYLLKGSSTGDFYRYNVSAGNWEFRAAAPTGASGKPFKDGSCVAWDGDNTIYALKGKFNEFYAYHVPGNFWTTLPALPVQGSAGRKRVKSGAGLACLAGAPALVFALKGGKTNEFWLYDGGARSWRELPPMPAGASSARVNGGGALVAAGDALYALKGNNTREFYRYRPGWLSARAPRPDPAGQGSRRGSASGGRQPRVMPNPARGRILVNCASEDGGPVTIRLHDVSGRRVRTIVRECGQTANHAVTVPLEGVPGGVYLLELESGTTDTITKLVVR